MDQNSKSRELSSAISDLLCMSWEESTSHNQLLLNFILCFLAQNTSGPREWKPHTVALALYESFAARGYSLDHINLNDDQYAGCGSYISASELEGVIGAGLFDVDTSLRRLFRKHLSSAKSGTPPIYEASLSETSDTQSVNTSQRWVGLHTPETSSPWTSPSPVAIKAGSVGLISTFRHERELIQQKWKKNMEQDEKDLERLQTMVEWSCAGQHGPQNDQAALEEESRKLIQERKDFEEMMAKRKEDFEAEMSKERVKFSDWAKGQRNWLDATRRELWKQQGELNQKTRAFQDFCAGQSQSLQALLEKGASIL